MKREKKWEIGRGNKLGSNINSCRMRWKAKQLGRKERNLKELRGKKIQELREKIEIITLINNSIQPILKNNK